MIEAILVFVIFVFVAMWAISYLASHLLPWAYPPELRPYQEEKDPPKATAPQVSKEARTCPNCHSQLEYVETAEVWYCWKCNIPIKEYEVNLN